jgi:hypothetical protein
MKNRNNTYRVVDSLPKNAITIKQYCAERNNCTASYIYKLWNMKQQGIETTINLDFEIVLFSGINWVIRKKPD